MDYVVSLGPLAIAALAVAANFYAVRSSRLGNVEARLLDKRAEVYSEAVAGTVELRDYARAPSRGSSEGVKPSPLLAEEHWLDLLAKVELLASASFRMAFEVLPGHVNQYRFAHIDDAESELGSSPEERREALRHFKEAKAKLIKQCDAVLEAVRTELGVTSTEHDPQAPSGRDSNPLPD